jgi:hypothetical protein
VTRVRCKGTSPDAIHGSSNSSLDSCFRPVAEVIGSSSISIFAAVLALVLAAVSHKRHIFIAPAVIQAPVLAVRGGALFRSRCVERTVDVGFVILV